MDRVQMDSFIDRLLAAAKEAGLETAEVYYSEAEAFSVGLMKGEVDSYEVSTSGGLGLRGTVDGRMGYAATEAYDEDAIAQLIEGVKESAALNEAQEQDTIFAGDAVYPEIGKPESDLADWSAEKKIALAHEIEQAALSRDSRVSQTQGVSVSTSRGVRILRNSYGLNLRREGEVCVAYASPIAREGEDTSTGFKIAAGYRLGDVKPAELGAGAADDALAMLHAKPVPSGDYRVILRREAMGDLLATFSGVFSAENAQQKLSLLAGREGEKIASDAVTLMDDPLLPGGFASTPFDGEGSASRTKAVIDAGTLTTLLHSRKTAKKQGVETTGNALRAGYAGAVRVGPTNFFIRPGEKSLEQLMAEVGDGLVITDVSGLHAGANPISGDFSLLSKGFVIRGGRQAEPVEQVTVAGNFYALLKNIRAVADDLRFDGRSIASPSVDAGVMKVSGK